MIAHLVVRRALPAALLVGAVFATPAQADVDSDIAALKAATAKYKDVKAALADGFMKDDMCVESPDGAGVMGYHYVNPKRIEAAPDVTKPPILVYQPDADGGRKLVAVEYFHADKDQDLSTSDDKPSLFGKPFDGPMEGHNPQMPKHYDLHAWVWQDNPKGTFAQYNPAGSCKVAEHAGMEHAGADKDAMDKDAMDKAMTKDAADKGTTDQVAKVPSGGAETGGGFADTSNGVENAWLFAFGAGALAAGAGLVTTGRRVAARKR